MTPPDLPKEAVHKGLPVEFVVRTDTGSQGVTGMDIQESLMEALSYTRDRIEVTPVELVLGAIRKQERELAKELVDAIEGAWQFYGGGDGERAKYVENAIHDARAALEDSDACAHDWVDATNEVVSRTEVCLKCGAVRPMEDSDA